MPSYWPGRPDRRRPWHRSNGSWDTICGIYGSERVIVTNRDDRVTCKRCLTRMQALLKTYGPSIAR